MLSNVVFWTSNAHCTHELTVPVVPLTKLTDCRELLKQKTKKQEGTCWEEKSFGGIERDKWG